MVQVEYWPRYPLMTVVGHAKTGVYGRDLVCAAVSILAHTLCESVYGFVEPGNARFYGGDRAAYEVIWKGFCRLEREYPGHVLCEKKGEKKHGRDGKAGSDG